MTEVDVPQELRGLRAFMNTLDVEQGSDEIADADGLAAWLHGRGLLAGGGRASRADVRSAHALRAALRDLVSGEADAADAAGAAEAVARDFPLRIAFDASGVARLEPMASGVRGALAAVLAGIPSAVAGGSWARLKLCGADDCQWVFYDQSKNRSRRWCSMAVCGNRSKSRAFRERQD